MKNPLRNNAMHDAGKQPQSTSDSRSRFPLSLKTRFHGSKPSPSRSFLGRLKSDTRGNILAMMAVGLFPLLALLGSALDMSRSYLVKNRLQQACDAAVLAGRRSMSGSTWTNENATIANRFFNSNFTPGRYGSQNSAIVYTVGSDMIVHGVATSMVPTVIMRVFGNKGVEIGVTCDAQLQLPNSDIMFVLDTTLSMSETNPGDATNRIAALRSAVATFYSTLEAAKVGGTQVRYGFVPYAQTVNVGMLLRREWMRDTAPYQSRVFAYQDYAPGGTQGATRDDSTGWSCQSNCTTPRSSYTVPPESCVAPSNTLTTNTENGGWNPNSSALPRERLQTRTRNGNTYSVSLSGQGICTVNVTTYNNYVDRRTERYIANPDAGEPTNGAARYYWDYQPVTYNVSSLKGALANGLMQGGSFTAPINQPGIGATVGNNRSITWNSTNACIEERDTVRTGETGTAFDLDVDLIPHPNRPETQWRPLLPSVVYARAQGSYSGVPAAGSWNVNTVRTTSNYVNLSSHPNDYAACPSPARKLDAALTLSQLTTYLTALTPRGQTYHDVGFLWGLRLMSAQGLFGAENESAPNGGQISRNLIFMTDGATDTDRRSYEAYGLSALDRRRTNAGTLPTDGQQNTIVEDRLAQLCAVARNQHNITVWVIAFGTDLSPLLTNCASPNRAYQANDSAQLNATFAEIAAQISQLRLTR